MRRTISMTNAFYEAQQLADDGALERYLCARGIDPVQWRLEWHDVGGGKILVLDALDSDVAPHDHTADGAPSLLISNQDGVLVLNPARVPNVKPLEQLYPIEVYPPTSVEHAPSGLRAVELALPPADPDRLVGIGT